MRKEKKRFSLQFWTPPSQKKEDFSKKDIKSPQKISDADVTAYEYKKIKDAFPEISSRLKLFFNNHLNFEDVKIEFIEHYDSLEISFKRDEKYLNYLLERSSEYKFVIAVKWEIMQICIEFKNLYKFLGIMGEQYDFQNLRDLLSFLQSNTTKCSPTYDSRLFGSNSGQVSSLVKPSNSQDYHSSRCSSTESSTESSNAKWRRSNFAYEANPPSPGFRGCKKA